MERSFDAGGTSALGNVSVRQRSDEVRARRSVPSRILTLYLIKIVPAFALVMFAWRVMGLDHLYYSLISLFLDVFYSTLNTAPWVEKVVVDAEHIVLGVSVNGKLVDLRLYVDYLTGNVVLLAVLFLASPIKPFVMRYVIHLVCAITILFGIHVVTMAIGAQLAFTSIPGLTANVPGTKIHLQYVRFYELVGMYLFVVLLWLPYMGGYLIRVRRCDRQDPRACCQDRNNTH